MITIRPANLADAQAIQAIYAPYVEKTAITFEYEVPSVQEFEKRISNTIERYPYLVAEEDGQVLGYAYASTYYARTAYDWTTELSIYLNEDARGRGLGSQLYGALEEELETKRRAVKGLTTMIENLTRRQEEIQSQIAELEAQQQESDSNKEDILRQIKFLNQTLTEIRINLREKRGKLDQVNQELDSLKSTYNSKLKGLDAIMKKDNVMINYINRDAEIILKASIFDQVLYEAVKICREIPEADAMAEDTFIDDRNNFRWQDVLSTGLRVFIAGIDGATGVAQVSGGGGTSNDMPWRDKDEDFLDWARRAMRYAHAKHYPGNRFKRSLSK